MFTLSVGIGGDRNLWSVSPDSRRDSTSPRTFMSLSQTTKTPLTSSEGLPPMWFDLELPMCPKTVHTSLLSPYPSSLSPKPPLTSTLGSLTPG